MCLGVPARVLRIEGSEATVAIGSVEYKSSLLLLNNVEVGDYILLHAGFAIEKIDPEEAEVTTRLFNEISNIEPE
ncbi:MAG: HypC/HybG/HupF family hydrogenase formation chaperone [Bacteroidales bacterium]|jgi:hydrogenase expression/formation protein HypC|nr:HypC/HybG/HupF family hydrogenase formation chaperone [Bacteroidales bacterium]